MDWITLSAVFVVVWWIVLFMVLPWGAQPPEVVEPGFAESAPARPRILLKFLITTVIAAALTPLVVALSQYGLAHLRPL
jgi:predicted secreted protein